MWVNEHRACVVVNIYNTTYQTNMLIIPCKGFIKVSDIYKIHSNTIAKYNNVS